MDKVNFISVVRDPAIYDKTIKNNNYVKKDDIKLTYLDNTIENVGISRRYNSFLEQFNFDDPSWLVFCHEDWEILEEISPKLEKLDKNCIYGSFGAKLQNNKGILTRQYIGEILDCNKQNKNYRRIGSKFENLTIVDVLDCQSLIVHSDLINKNKLRFDVELDWDLYVEDFCLNARTKHKIKSKVLDLKVCHWSQLDNVSERPSSTLKYPYINSKYKNYTFAGMSLNIGKDTENIRTIDFPIQEVEEQNRSKIYQNQVMLKNDSRYISIGYVENEKKLLDVGCACGDFAVALKDKKKAKIWGMDYNVGSIATAKDTGMFEDVFRVDLNSFNPSRYKEFFGYFDYIVLGDVLEHLYYPQKTLDRLGNYLNAGGTFILSIPNIAHASIKSNLLLDDFTYTPYGLLDETHIRFFTQKSISSFLADINLEIVKNKFTYLNKKGFQPTDPYTILDPKIKKVIFEDYQSYVLQYVMEVKKSKLEADKIVLINSQKLTITDKNAPQELSEIRSEDLRLVESEMYRDEKDKDALLKHKEHEIYLMKSSKFWKLRESYVRLRTLLKNPLRLATKITRHNKKVEPSVASVDEAIGVDEGREGYLENIINYNKNGSKEFIKIANKPLNKNVNTKLIAFYLPQFHPIDINDIAYGRGFTEWNNVASAIPQFTGHYQPQLPYDVCFYDLRNIDVMRRQVELAKLYGVYGFCFHYYWFSGQKLLETPILNWLKNKDLDLPFCLCWANENWTKKWDAGDSGLLVKQELNPEDDTKFMKDIMPYLEDARYITMHGKPVLIVYRPHLFEKQRVKKLFSNFRRYAEAKGLKGLYIIGAKTHNFNDSPSDWGLDAIVEFPPHGLAGKAPIKQIVGYKNPNFKGTVYDMEAYVKGKKYKNNVDHTLYNTVFTSWDNTARKAYSSASVFDLKPSIYKEWLTGVIENTKERNLRDEQYIFINAWNEWAEGAHLEPDAKYGYAYLESTRRALEESSHE